jgi:hypothetical protein
MQIFALPRCGVPVALPTGATRDGWHPDFERASREPLNLGNAAAYDSVAEAVATGRDELVLRPPTLPRSEFEIGVLYALTSLYDKVDMVWIGGPDREFHIAASGFRRASCATATLSPQQPVLFINKVQEANVFVQHALVNLTAKRS